MERKKLTLETLKGMPDASIYEIYTRLLTMLPGRFMRIYNLNTIDEFDEVTKFLFDWQKKKSSQEETKEECNKPEVIDNDDSSTVIPSINIYLDVIKVMDSVALTIFTWDVLYLDKSVFESKYSIHDEEMEDIIRIVKARLKSITSSI